MGRRGKPRPKQAKTPWLPLILLAYGPLTLTLGLAFLNGELWRRGHVALVERVLGPLCLVCFGWTFAGFTLAAALYGSFPIIEDGPPSGPGRWLRVALAWMPAGLGVGVIGVGIWLFLRAR